MIALLVGVGQTVFNHFDWLWVQTIIKSAIGGSVRLWIHIGSKLQYNVTYGKTHSTNKASQAFDILMEETDIYQVVVMATIWVKLNNLLDRMLNLYLIQMLKVWRMLVIKKMMHGISFNRWRNWGNVVIKHECKQEIWIMFIVFCSQVINIQWKHKNISRWHVLVWSKAIIITWGRGCIQVWHATSFVS